MNRPPGRFPPMIQPDSEEARLLAEGLGITSAAAAAVLGRKLIDPSDIRAVNAAKAKLARFSDRQATAGDVINALKTDV